MVGFLLAGGILANGWFGLKFYERSSGNPGTFWDKGPPAGRRRDAIHRRFQKARQRQKTMAVRSTTDWLIFYLANANRVVQKAFERERKARGAAYKSAPRAAMNFLG